MWRTPSANLIEAKKEGIKLKGRTPKDPQVGLADQVQAYWRTPTAQQMGTGKHMDSAGLKLGQRVYNKNGKLMAIDLNRQMDIVERQSESARKSFKMNPRWVEALMGIPIGWTMPNCASPATVEPMN